MLACPPIDPALGTVLRVSGFLDCRARLLGEAGYEALAGNLIASGAVAGLITIFIALIGYRFLLGEQPGLRDGVGWGLRLGFALALATAWPAFQTVIYRVAVDGPVELAAVLSPGGEATQALDARAQRAYDTIRLGRQRTEPRLGDATASPADRQAADVLALTQAYQFEPPMPRTATLFLLVAVGVTGALRVAIGFLLALGPLVLFGLLFAATTGLVVGWVRALVGAALAATGASVVAALAVDLIEAELARLQTLGLTVSAETADATALSGFVLLFALIMVVTGFAAAKISAALDWQAAAARIVPLTERFASAGRVLSSPSLGNVGHRRETAASESMRVSAIVDALGQAVRREETAAASSNGTSRNGSLRRGHTGPAGPTGSGIERASGGGTRRDLGRTTRLARQRDRRP